MQEQRLFRCLSYIVLSNLILLSILPLLLGSQPAVSVQNHPANRAHMVPLDFQYVYIGQAGEPTYHCQKDNAPQKCYGVQQIRNAYGMNPLLQQGITGKGRTIVILDAYQAPHLRQDLDAFNQHFHLPAAPLTIVAPDGVPTWDAKSKDQLEWSGEISLDVEWAHAVAPEAAIVLVESKSADDPDIISALKYAINKDFGDVISMSFGEGENCPDATLRASWHEAFYTATRKGMTLLTSSGDQGVAQQSCDGNSWTKIVAFPASDPLVTSVGGSNLDADVNTGSYASESAWNEVGASASTGGGFSNSIPAPFYQRNIPGSSVGRGVPDVAYNSSVIHGVITFWSDGVKGAGSAYSFGGTSAGTPQWAAIIALADQYSNCRLGFINPAIYVIGGVSSLYHAAFRDIITGSSLVTLTNTAKHVITLEGYTASPGWDAVTGWGSPIVSGIVPLLSIVMLPGNSGTDTLHLSSPAQRFPPKAGMFTPFLSGFLPS